ncbi:MAG TPA: methyltransferase domain-containing protein [Terriglobales bacterium]|nr:methyltransferase domain-containing protein [Terriglobales bacterium]
MQPQTGKFSLIGTFHEKLVFGRRVRVLARHLSALIPARARVLDVGCGDGMIDRVIMEQRPDVSIEGIDPLVRPHTHIPVRSFDGERISHSDSSFNVVMFVDVLHHTVNPLVLLKEAVRVGSTILIKDHFRNGLLAGTTLRLMDWVGNAHHRVALPYNYLSKAEWGAAFDHLGLRAKDVNSSLGLYPPPLSWIFERELHFVAIFEKG